MTYKFEVKMGEKVMLFGEYIFDDKKALKTATQILNKLGCVEVIISRRASPYEGAYKHWISYGKRHFEELPYGYLKRG